MLQLGLMIAQCGVRNNLRIGKTWQTEIEEKKMEEMKTKA
jgi:hypothetical protein